MEIEKFIKKFFHYLFNESLRAFATLNLTDLDAEILIAFPVCGFLPEDGTIQCSVIFL